MNVSDAYCARLASWMRNEVGLAADTAIRLEDAPPTPCGTTSTGQPLICVIGGDAPRKLVATTGTGETFERTLPCGGISRAAICFESPPPIQAIPFSTTGYWDTPCTGEAPSGCATPVVPDPDAVKQAKPLRIDAVDVPVGEVGHREVEIGRAWVPNGVLSKVGFALASSQTQDGFELDPAEVAIKIVSADPSRPPFTNVHERKLFPGVEEVRVLIVFDVAQTSPSAVLHVIDVDVE